MKENESVAMATKDEKTTSTMWHEVKDTPFNICETTYKSEKDEKKEYRICVGNKMAHPLVFETKAAAEKEIKNKSWLLISALSGIIAEFVKNETK